MSGSPQMSVHPKHIKLQSHNITDHDFWQNKLAEFFGKNQKETQSRRKRAAYRGCKASVTIACATPSS